MESFLWRKPVQDLCVDLGRRVQGQHLEEYYLEGAKHGDIPRDVDRHHVTFRVNYWLGTLHSSSKTIAICGPG